MKKYLFLLKYELKNLAKDKMSIFMFVYPFFMLFFAGFLMPRLMRANTDVTSGVYVTLIMFLVSVIVGSFMGGILLGFSLLENKDENTFCNISVTPASVKGYILFKSVYCTALSFLSSLIIIFGLKLFASEHYVLHLSRLVEISLLGNLSTLNILIFSFVSSLITPAIALIIAAAAKNKIEGFVFIKTGGLIILLPVLIMLEAFGGYTQYLLGFLPNFWAVKALYNAAIGYGGEADLSFAAYMIIGCIIPLLYSIVFYRLFIKKIR